MLRKKVWLMNHYAINMYFNRGGRHYWFAKHLKHSGYEPTIFCANTRHGKGVTVAVLGGKYIRVITGSIPFVIVKTTDYRGDLVRRINNMIMFSWNLYRVAKQYSKIYGKPDLILASSVHPLTMVTGIKVAQLFGVPCICEIRDLWPESFVAYNILKENNPFLKLLYAGEKWIYKKADRLIFTMEGGKDYIVEKGWDQGNGGPIDLKKVYHINNGVDLDEFDYNKEHYTFEDADLEDADTFKVVYTGSIRLVNKVEIILDAAKLLTSQNIKLLIWGDGDQLEHLRKRVKEEQINNVCFKGRVDKKFIPFITTRSHLNVIFGRNMPLFRFGGSMNKMFDYFASGKPILSTFKIGYSIVEKYNTGIELDDSRAETIAESILYFKNLDQVAYNEYCTNACKAAQDYNFELLTDKLIDIIKSL